MRIDIRLVMVLGFLSSTAFAGPLEDGKAAFDGHDYQTALRLLQPLADQGNPEAQYEIGLMYENGWGVQQDFVVAMKWLGKSADQGISWAQYHIGYLYANGLGVPENKAEADKWYGKAKAEGNNFTRYEYVEPTAASNQLPLRGVVPDGTTAIQVAEVILKPVYGEDKVKREEPFTATLDGDTWTVTGHFPDAKGTLGGVAIIKLSKSKGTVLLISHGM